MIRYCFFRILLFIKKEKIVRKAVNNVSTLCDLRNINIKLNTLNLLLNVVNLIF